MGLDVKVGSFNLDTTKTAGQTQSVTGLGFQPKVVLFFWCGSIATIDSLSGGSIRYGFGAAISSSSRFGVYGFAQDNVATSNTGAIQDNNGCIYFCTDALVDKRIDFVSMDAGGFTIIYDTTIDQNYRISYMALGGDDLTNVYIGSKVKPGVTGNFDVTDVGFQPDAVLFGGIYSTLVSEFISHCYTHFGMAAGASNQGVVQGWSRNGMTTQNTSGYGYNGECNGLHYYNGMFDRATFVEFLSNGFRLNQLEGTGLYYFHYVCLKGGQYKVHELTTRTDGADIVESDVGFQPKGLLFFSANRALSTQDTKSDHHRLSFGAASSASEVACAAVSDESGVSTTECAYANYDSVVYAHVKDDALEASMDIKSIDASGFTCVMTDTETAGCWVTYMAIGANAGGEGITVNLDTA